MLVEAETQDGVAAESEFYAVDGGVAAGGDGRGEAGEVCPNVRAANEINDGKVDVRCGMGSVVGVNDDRQVSAQVYAGQGSHGKDESICRFGYGHGQRVVYDSIG